MEKNGNKIISQKIFSIDSILFIIKSLQILCKILER